MDRIIAIAYNRALRNQRREKTSWFFMSKDFGQDHCRLEQCICSRDLIFQQASGFFSWMEFCQSRTKAPRFYPRNVAGSNDKVLRRQQRRKKIHTSLDQFSSMQITLLLEANVNYELRKSTSVFFRERKFLQMTKKKKKYTLSVRSAAIVNRKKGERICRKRGNVGISSISTFGGQKRVISR